MSVLPGFDEGKRSERTEYGVRLTVDHGVLRRGDIEECTEHKARWLTSVEAQDELPYHGYPANGLELVTRTVASYTSGWSTA